MLRNFSILILTFIIVLCSCGGNEEKKAETTAVEKYKKTGSFEVLDPAFLSLVDTGAGIEILAEGFDWSEGPVWINKGNYLLFSDIPLNRIMKWSEEKGLETYLKPAGYTGADPRAGESGSNGLTLDANGNLVLCQHGDRRLARMEASLDSPLAKFVTLADKFEGKRLNSPNDAVFHKNGDLFFTDPPYGLLKNVDDSSKEISFQGVYHVKKDGSVQLVTKNMSRPNGIAFSPDYTKLYVANSDGDSKIWKVFDVDADGATTNERVFVDVTKETDAARPDGMKVDSKGNLFATGPGGVLIFNSEGKLLGKIKPGQLCANVAFNADQSALYITSDPWLTRVKLK